MNRNLPLLQLDYGESPRLWTLDISDSAEGDGYGGDNGTDTSMAEAHVHNRQLRVYGNGLPGYMDASLNGGHLLHVMDDVVKKGMAFNPLLLILCVENLRR